MSYRHTLKFLLVGPIALYPDELLAITLPASTYPLEVVQAARYLDKRKTEPELKPNESWAQVCAFGTGAIRSWIFGEDT